MHLLKPRGSTSETTLAEKRRWMDSGLLGIPAPASSSTSYAFAYDSTPETTGVHRNIASYHFSPDRLSNTNSMLILANTAYIS